MFPALKDGIPTGESRPAVAGANSSEGAVQQVKAEAQGQGLPAGTASPLKAGEAAPAAPGASLSENPDGARATTSGAAGAGADANPEKAVARQAQAAGGGGEVDKNSPQVDAGAKGGAGQSAAPRSAAGQAPAAALRGVETAEVDVRATIAVTGNGGAKASATASADATGATEKAQASARAAAMVPGQAATGRRSAEGAAHAAAPAAPTDVQEDAPLSGRAGHVSGEPLAGDDGDRATEPKRAAHGNGIAPGRSDQTTSPATARQGVSAAALAFAAAVREQAGAPSETDTDGALEFGRAEPMPGSSASQAMARGTAPQPLPQHAAAASVQVASEVARQASKGVNRFQIRLDPAELGRIDVDMKIGADGTVRAHLAVERSETLDMFLRDQRGLERALDAAGLKLDGGSLQFSLKDQGGFAGFGRDGAAEQMAETGGAERDAAAAGEFEDASVLPARVHVDGASGALDIQI
ncbi:flagellar hook-length control protein FliK [Stappia taiwanensis]|uniref:Flagellar hook-length control protein FliK n=1 Tax=Stappia taiwanensis TaxID=992267 RepID=A0A838XW33_9HYPH|nr:flagellar hook-length control protein FliK [Stappia taiwanensis]MBA4611264.1 flagellar hook-length control protein FliK [Stappia taiwanensis]